MVAGPDFGGWEGQVLICVIYIYGLKKYMDRYNQALSDNIKMIGFHPYKADPDLQMQDSGYHYEYISIYADDLIVFRK